MKLDRRTLLWGSTTAVVSRRGRTAGATSFEAELKLAAATLRQERRTANAAGVPLFPAEVTVPAARADRNAAPLYAQLDDIRYELHHADTAAPYRVLTRALRFPISPTHLQECRKVLKYYAGQLELARIAATLPRCVIDLHWDKVPEVVRPPYNGIRFASILLSVAAILEAEDGDSRGALNSLEAAGQVHRHIAEEPRVYTLASAARQNGFALKSLREVLGRHLEDPEILRAAELALPSIVAIPQPHLYWRGEALFSILATRRHRRELPTYGFDFRTEEQKREDREFAKYPLSLLTAAWESRLLSFHRRVLPLFSNFAAAPHLRLPRVQKLVKEEGRQKGGSYRSSRELAVSAEFAALDSVRCLAQLRLHQALLAVLTHRQRTGALPTQLAPSLTDPFSGKPIRFRQRDGEVLLYCVGRDLKDDGGSEEPREHPDYPKDMMLRFPLKDRAT